MTEKTNQKRIDLEEQIHKCNLESISKNIILFKRKII